MLVHVVFSVNSFVASCSVSYVTWAGSVSSGFVESCSVSYRTAGCCDVIVQVTDKYENADTRWFLTEDRWQSIIHHHIFHVGRCELKKKHLWILVLAEWKAVLASWPLEWFCNYIFHTGRRVHHLWYLAKGRGTGIDVTYWTHFTNGMCIGMPMHAWYRRWGECYHQLLQKCIR